MPEEVKRMYPFIYRCDVKKIDIAKIIKNPAELEIFRPLYMNRPALKGIKFLIPSLFHEPESSSYPTVLRFPPEAAGTKAEQVQNLNYDNFIHVMAEMVQKYALEILG